MKVQILSGVMIKGTAVFPMTGTDKNAKPSIVEVDKAEARDLIANKQAKRADDKAKISVEIKDPTEAKDELDAYFDEEDEEDEGE
ncbi:hypothetical protein [Shewanella surugensis]|uniref:Phage protein n=1 Tax=Shewanella surugensis TaxID=212020 RepID=A0ABT0L943_9GAMM|nr:hypothetical protein [Shewanella surugensis]MCL1124233.1 hypothetical protein [Shewanella surugensis]